MNPAEHRSIFACLLILLLISTVIASPAAAAISPTTTLSAETGNNTSASSSFQPSTNANAGAGNVSKLPIRSLLYPGATTKIYANWLGWFGPSNHISVGYRSDDPAQVHRQVEDMISRGIQGAVVDWFGPNQDPVNAATKLMMAEAEAHPGFEFSIMEDVGALGNAAKANGCDVTTQIINDLNYAMQQYAGSPAYTRIAGRPVLFFFGVSAYYIDWNKVRASVAGNPLFIFRGSFGFNHTASDGAFQWLDLNSTDPFDPELAAQDSFYAAALKTSEVAFGSAYKGFNDTVAAWSVNRFIHQRCGQTWLATMAEIAKFYSSSNQLQAIQLVTWNDYEEGTEIETGIDGCTYLTPSISGGTLSWTIAGGPENTVHHYTVFASTDGQNLAKLADVPAGTHSLNLSTFMLSPANYVLYVKAVGKPSFQNKMSPAIVFRPGDQPPSFSLTVSSVGAQTATATINGASDANGIGSTTIDFGDGTIVSGPSATHTYARSDSYIVTATVADRLGATSVVRKKVTVKSPNAGVTVLGPATGATVNSPVLFTATANSGSANITTMRIYVDGKATYTIDQDHILTSLKLYKGTHNVVVQAWDVTGAVFKSSLTLNAEPTDLPPKAAVTVRALPAVSPLTVLACAATSSDPDGFISGTAMQFSDGVLVNTRGAVHTFSAPGNYSVNVAVMDQFGAVGSTTLPFSVPLSSQPGVGVTVSSPANGAVLASPVHFVASATSPTAPITAMAIYVDYKLALLVNAASLDRSLPIPAGGHSVIVQAWDATGAVFKTSLTITVSGGGGGSGVTVSSPTNGATVSSPVHFVASASSANAAVTAMAIYIDYKLALQVKAASVDQSLAVTTGAHSVIVQAWDATGAVFKTPLNITVTATTASAAPVSP